MKEPIEPSEIRLGDVIRWETDGVKGRGPFETAAEYVAAGSEDSYSSFGQHFLIEARPEPVVELPTEDHHFGWLSAPGTRLARPGVAGEWFFGDRRITASGFSDGIERGSVTEWTPGTLIPTAALDELREWHSTAPEPTWGRIATFLAAVDEAQS